LWAAWREVALIAACAGVLAVQLLLPGFIGLADNGDFPKIAGRLCIGPADPQARTFEYFESDYLRTPRYCWQSGIPSSESVPVKLAARFQKTAGGAGHFDIRWLGAVHASVFLAFYYVLLTLLRPLGGWRWLVLAVAALWIFADVSYISYFNSFYTDTAALLGAMLAIAAAPWLLPMRRARVVPLIVFAAGALAYVTSKGQHGLFGLVPASFALVLGLRARSVVRWAAWATAVGLLAGSIWVFAATPAWNPQLERFNVIFFNIAKNSRAPFQDLRELGLDAGDLPYVGMLAFTPGSPTNDVAWLDRFGRRTSYSKVLAFYTRHPDRMLSMLRMTLKGDASQIRPNLSNFRRQEGRPAGAITQRFGSWSFLRSWLLLHCPVHMLVWYALILVGVPSLLLRARFSSLRPIGWIVFAVALVGAGEFGVATLADASETYRHLLLFHLLTDFTIFLTLLAALSGRAWAARPGIPAGLGVTSGNDEPPLRELLRPIQSRERERPVSEKLFSLLLPIIAAASLIPRLILGASQFIHYDGYMHIFIATQDRWKFFWVENRGDAHPPLFYALLHFVSLLGHSHLVYRSIGILAGCASTYVIGLVAAKVCRNAAIALLAAAAYGFAITNIDLTIDVRGYPIAILFVLLAFHAYLDYLARPLSDAAPGAVARFGCFTALAILSEYCSVFFLAACLVVPWVRALTDKDFRRALLVSVRRLWRPWALTLGGVAGVVFVLYRVHLRYQPAVEDNVSTFYWSPQSGTSLWRFLIDGLRLEIDYFFPLPVDSNMKAGLIVVLFLAAFFYLVFFRKGRSKDAVAAMAPAMLAALVCELVILSLMGKYPFGGELRHQSIIAPFVVLTGFVVVERFVAALRYRPARAAAVTLVLALILVNFDYRWSRFPKVPQELASEQYRTFRSLFPEGTAIYADSFSATVYFIHNHNSPWAFERRYGIGSDWVYVYRTKDELGRGIEIVRDREVWNFDLSDPGTFKRLAESIRASGLRSAALFWIKQDGAALESRAARAEESRYRAYASAAGLTYKRSYFDGSQGYIELEVN